MDPGGEGGRGVRARPGRNVPLARRDRFRRGHQWTPGKIRDPADLVLPVPREVGTVPEGGLTLLRPESRGKAGRFVASEGGSLCPGKHGILNLRGRNGFDGDVDAPGLRAEAPRTSLKAGTHSRQRL